MCIAFWTLDHPDFALILCSNRDEFLARPTAPAHWHSFGPIGTDEHGEGDVLSGRDLSAGGTWAGISRTGRLALLTNITEPLRQYASSRGDLTAAFLQPQTPGVPLQAEVDAFLAANRDRAYAGFNMLLLSPARPGSLGGGGGSGSGREGLSFDGAIITNSGGGGTLVARELAPDERRCGALSNGLAHPGAEAWPKVRHGRGAFARDVLDALPRDAAEAELVERLFALLTWQSDPPPASRDELRNTIHVAPVPIRLAHASDPPSPSSSAGSPASGPPPAAPTHYYGTRLSTAVLVRHDGRATFVERDVWTLDPATGAPARGDPARDRVFHFQVAFAPSPPAPSPPASSNESN